MGAEKTLASFLASVVEEAEKSKFQKYLGKNGKKVREFAQAVPRLPRKGECL